MRSWSNTDTAWRLRGGVEKPDRRTTNAGDAQMRRALICGVSGQDGAYLAQLLLSQGYEVYGSSRDAQASSFRNLKALGIHDKIRLVSVAITDFRSVLQALKIGRASCRERVCQYV